MSVVLRRLCTVFTCTVAKKQNGRICKNTVLMETAFHSTSGFHLNPLIGENVTISVLLWKPWRERERACLIFPRPGALSPTIKPKRRLSRVHEIECACQCQLLSMGGSRHAHPHTHSSLSETHLARHDRVISNEVFTTESGFQHEPHRSACACQEAPTLRAALSQVEQEKRETE